MPIKPATALALLGRKRQPQLLLPSTRTVTAPRAVDRPLVSRTIPFGTVNRPPAALPVPGVAPSFAGFRALPSGRGIPFGGFSQRLGPIDMQPIGPTLRPPPIDVEVEREPFVSQAEQDCQAAGGTWYGHPLNRCEMPPEEDLDHPAAVACRAAGGTWYGHPLNRCEMPPTQDDSQQQACEARGGRWTPGFGGRPGFCAEVVEPPTDDDKSPEQIACEARGGRWFPRLHGRSGGCVEEDLPPDDDDTLRQACVAAGGRWVNGQCEFVPPDDRDDDLTEMTPRELCEFAGGTWNSQTNSCTPPPTPGFPPETLTPFGPGNNLINFQINPVANEQLQRTQGLLDAARDRLASFPGITANLNQGLLNQALAMIRGISIPEPGAIPGLDLAAARSLFEQARGELGQARIPDLGAVDLTDLSGARRLAGLSEAEVRGAVLDQPDTAQVRGTVLDELGQVVGGTDLAQLRSDILEDLGTVREGTDRASLAAEAFRLIQEAGEPVYQRGLREVGQRAATLGRIGAGVTTNELTDVFTQRERDLDFLRRGLALEAAQQTLQDRFGILGATQGVSQQFLGQDIQTLQATQGVLQQFFGQDINEAQLGLARAATLQSLAEQEARFGTLGTQERFAERAFQAQQDLNQANLALSRARGLGDQGAAEAALAQAERATAERDRALQLAQDNLRAQVDLQKAQGISSIADQDFQAALQKQLANLQAQQGIFQNLQSLEAQLFGQGVTQRGELRGERQYQLGLSRQAIEDQIRQRAFEEQLFAAEFARQMELLRFLAQLGFSESDIQNILLDFGDTLSSQGGGDLDLAALIAQLLGEQAA